MNCVAIIPARGGSKGIPRKNISVVAGKPLVAYTIEHAKATPAIDRVVVSTDTPDIAAVATRYGAEVVWRPAEISGDGASSESAMLHALDELAVRDGYRPDLVVLLQATSPVRHAQDVQRAIDMLTTQGADSLFSACVLHGFLWRENGEGVSSISYDYRARRPRQELAQDLVENGSIYVTRHDLLRATGNRLGGRIAVYRMDPLDSFQVDQPPDLAIVERVLRWRGHAASPLHLVDVDLLVLDFDGVMTDDRVLVDQHGTEAVWCHRGDGWGIARLRDAGVGIVVLSTEANPVVGVRCRKLRIDAVQACDDKLSTLQQLASARRVPSSRIAYVGNDVNDLACLQWVGMPIAVADAAPDVRAACRYVTSRAGGRGAVREVADWILATRRQPAGLSL
jgi:YrbI family 3-deoxy-D-manno-octulosonate 8-phosphate phosphatase